VRLFLLIAALAIAGCGSGGDGKSLAQGRALLAEGKYEAAAAELAKATAQDRNSMDAWLSLGDAYRGMKRYDDALSAYVAAKKIDRHSIVPHLAHAKVQVDLGHVELATTELNLVVEMDPKNLEARKGYARVLEKFNDPRGAATHYRKMLEISDGYDRTEPKRLSAEEVGTIEKTIARLEGATSSP